MSERSIPPELQDVLTRMAETGGQSAKDAALLAEALRTDPVFTLMAESNRELIRSIRKIPEQMQQDTESMRQDMRSWFRNLLIVVCLAMVLNAGLNGVAVWLDSDGSVRTATPTSSVPTSVEPVGPSPDDSPAPSEDDGSSEIIDDSGEL